MHDRIIASLELLENKFTIWYVLLYTMDHSILYSLQLSSESNLNEFQVVAKFLSIFIELVYFPIKFLWGPLKLTILKTKEKPEWVKNLSSLCFVSLLETNFTDRQYRNLSASLAVSVSLFVSVSLALVLAVSSSAGIFLVGGASIGSAVLLWRCCRRLRCCRRCFCCCWRRCLVLPTRGLAALSLPPCVVNVASPRHIVVSSLNQLRFCFIFFVFFSSLF